MLARSAPLEVVPVSSRTRSRLHLRSSIGGLVLAMTMFPLGASAATVAARPAIPAQVSPITTGRPDDSVGRHGDTAAHDTGSAARVLPLRHLPSPRQYGSPLRAVATDSVTLHRLWALATSPDARVPEPRVDFTNEMVILVALGSQPTTGWGIRVDSVTTTAEHAATVFVNITVPVGCVVGQAFTLPTDVVIVRSGPVRPLVRFAEHVDTKGCPPPRFEHFPRPLHPGGKDTGH